MNGHAPHFDVEDFADPAAALARVHEIYDLAVEHLRRGLQHYVDGADIGRHVRACYPLLRVRTDTVARADSRLSYGFVAGPGVFETTLTRPDLFGDYYLEQFTLLLQNHQVELEVGVSHQPIPVHFSFAEHDHIEGTLSAERRQRMRDLFDLPDLAAMDDGIANGTHQARAGEALPLALFTAPRVDYSLHRLRHYTGTAPEHFQNFVLFTNYQFYIDEFVRLGRQLMSMPASGQSGGDGYVAFVEPGDRVHARTGPLPTAAAPIVDAGAGLPGAAVADEEPTDAAAGELRAARGDDPRVRASGRFRLGQGSVHECPAAYELHAAEGGWHAHARARRRHRGPCADVWSAAGGCVVRRPRRGADGGLFRNRHARRQQQRAPGRGPPPGHTDHRRTGVDLARNQSGARDRRRRQGGQPEARQDGRRGAVERQSVQRLYAPRKSLDRRRADVRCE